ncbi:hypothetical protein H0H87_009978 [Tephrocybe sp. NHM501043]|nr:hypothetical protein H0H87_009978 [Tephrocybe sp. NHM501043]
MHPVLEIQELLQLIFYHLLQDDCPDNNRCDLLSCALTCKTFSEAAFDAIWQKPPRVDVLPLEDKSLSNPYNSPVAYAKYIERLKFYGKRVRALRVHDELTAEQFRITIDFLQLTEPPSYQDSESHDHIPLISRIFPALTSLSLAISENSDFDTILTAHSLIHTFLLPTVKILYINYAAVWTGCDNLTDILRSISLIPPHAQPALTSLTFDSVVVSLFPEALPLDLDLALSHFISTLLNLQTLSLPFYLLSERVFTAIAALPELREFTLGQPTHPEFDFCNPSLMGPFSILSSKLVKDAFASLRRLTMHSTFEYIPQVFNAHPALTKHLAHLSLSCAPPPPWLTLRALFSSTSPSPLLQNLTHLSINFKSITLGSPQEIDIAFFRPLLDDAPFTANLISLHIVHAVPLDLDDGEYEEIARCLRGVVDVRFDAIVRTGVRGGKEREPKSKIKAGLGTVEAFVRYCRRLRRITVVVDAESLPLPPILPIDDVPTSALPHPVYVDMSISPIGPDVESVGRFLGRFLEPRSEVNGRRDSGGEDGNGEEEEDGDVYAQRWGAVGEVLKSGRGLEA